MNELPPLTLLYLNPAADRAREDCLLLESPQVGWLTVATLDQALERLPGADALLFALEPGGGPSQATAAQALLAVADLPLLVYVAEDAVAELEAFDRLPLAAVLPRSSSPQFTRHALRVALQRAQESRRGRQKESGLQAALEGANADLNARKALQAELVRWKEAFQHASWGIAISSQDGQRLAQVNLAFARMHGQTQEEMAGSPILDLFTPECRAEALEQIQTANRLGYNVFELRHVRKDGSSFPCLIDASAVYGPDGAFLYRIVNLQDITVRKQIEEQLHASEEKHRTLIATMSEGVSYNEALYDSAGQICDFRIQEVNPAFAAAIQTAAPPSGGLASQLLGLSPDFVRGLWRRSSDPARPALNELIHPISGRHFLISASPLLNGHFVTTFFDITALRQSEQALRELSRERQVTLDTLSIGISRVQDHRVIWANRAHDQIFGYLPGATRGLAVASFYPDPDAFLAFDDAFYPRLLAGEVVAVERQLRRRDGALFWAAMTGRLIDPRQLELGSIWTISDISARKEMELALRENEQRYHNLFTSSMDGIIITDASGRTLAANPAACAMLRMSETEILRVGRSGIIDMADPRFVAALDERERAGSFRGELTYRRADGSTFPVEVSTALDRSLPGLAQTSIIFRDISERKHREAALRKSEERYRGLFENMVEGFALHEIILDAQGSAIDFRFLSANAAYERHTGFKPSDVLGKTMLEILPNADRAQIERYGRVALGGEPLDFEYESQTFQRRLRVRAFSPAPGLFATLFEDVSAVRRTEAALRESEQKYRVFFENRINAIAIFDIHTLRILDANDALLELYGYQREELLSAHTILDLSAEEMASSASIQRTLENRSDYVPLRYHRRKDGSRFPVEIESGVFDWQGRSVMYGIVHDLSERIRAEDQLSFQSHLLREVKQTIVATDLEGHYTYFNPFAETLFGHRPAEMLGRLDADIFRQPHLLAQTREIRAQVLQQGIWKGEILTANRQGVPLILEATVSLFRDERGQPAGYISILEEISQRKKVEAEIRDLLAQKDLLIREVHHRVKNNMASIAGLLAIQARRVGDASAADVLREAEDRVRGMQTIYDRLYCSGGYEQLNTRAYLETLIADIHASWVRPELSVDVQTAIEDFELPLPVSFPLGILINECLTNAYRHAFQGRAQGQIRLELRHTAACCLLSIADDGVGLPPGVLPGLSSGFGMFLIQAMQQQLGATLAIDRTRGTAYVFTIPAAA